MPCLGSLVRGMEEGRGRATVIHLITTTSRIRSGLYYPLSDCNFAFPTLTALCWLDNVRWSTKHTLWFVPFPCCAMETEKWDWFSFPSLLVSFSPLLSLSIFLSSFPFLTPPHPPRSQLPTKKVKEKKEKVP